MNISFRKINYLGFYIAAAAVIVTGALGIYHAVNDGALAGKVTARIEIARMLGDASKKALSIRNQVLTILSTTDPKLEKTAHDGLLRSEEELLVLVEQIYRMPGLDADEQKSISAFKVAWSSYRDVRERVVLVSGKRGQEQSDVARVAANTAFSEAMQNLSALQQMNADRANIHLDHIRTLSSAFIYALAAVTVVVVLLCLLGGAYVGRRMTNSLLAMVGAAEAMAEGDFSRRVAMQGCDDLCRMAKALNKIGDNLASLIQQVSDRSYEVSLGSKQLYKANDNFAHTLTVQTAMVEETAATMDEMAEAIRQNADAAREANRLMSQARQSAEDGGSVMENTFDAMKEISSSSRMIADIIGVIDEIAFQTNLLALNAAVEAARAGEHGKGFAVVAQEVRNLSQRSAKAAKEVSVLIQENLKKTENGSLLADQSMATLREIVSSVKQMAELVAEISTASQEQAHGAEQVRQAVVQLDEVTQQNAALHQESSAAAGEMAEQAQHLCSMVRSFKVSRDDGGRAGAPSPEKAAPSLEGGAPQLPEGVSGAEAGLAVSGKVTPLRKPVKRVSQGRSRSFEPMQGENDEF